MPKPSDVLVYLTGGQHWIGGVQYTRNLLSAVSLLPASERPTLVVRISEQNRQQGYEEDFGRMRGVLIDGPVVPTRGDRLRYRWFGRALPQGAYAHRCKVAFPAKGPDIPDPQFKIYWIPDFQYKNLPDFFPVDERKRRDDYYARMHREARLMVLSSRAVEQDYRKFFPEAAHVRTELLPFVTSFSDEEWNGAPEAVVAQHKLPSKFLYAPNQIWQHKGHDTIFEALALLKAQGIIIPVVCTGNAVDYRDNSYSNRLQDFLAGKGLSGQAYFLGLLPRPEQVQLFRQCALVVQASRFEGWSTVVEDTRAVGKPIVVSDLAVHREQAPAQSAFFKVGDPRDLANTLANAWNGAEPGTNAARERVARRQSEARARDFARNFLRIVGIAEEMARTQG